MQVTLQSSFPSLSEGTLGSFWRLAFDHMSFRSKVFVLLCDCLSYFSPVKIPILSRTHIQHEKLKGRWDKIATEMRQTATEMSLRPGSHQGFASAWLSWPALSIYYIQKGWMLVMDLWMFMKDTHCKTGWQMNGEGRESESLSAY